MASRFIGKTALAGLQPLVLAGRPVQDGFATYRSLLLQHAGPEAANLFAEPIVTWREGSDDTGSISWYCEATGEPQPIATLSAENRANVAERLTRLLASLQPALAEPRLGPWLQRALVLAGDDDILSVGPNVVLTGWGLVRHQPDGEAELAAMTSAVLGPYLPRDVPQRAPVTAAILGMTAQAAPATIPVGAPGRPVALPTAVRVTRRASIAGSWSLVPAGALVAAAFLALGLWQGSRLVAARFAARASTVDVVDEAGTRAAIARQSEQNAALEREIEARRRVLAGDVCQLDPAQVPRIGPDRAAPVPAAVVPPPPGGQAFNGSLADLLKQAVVLIIAPGHDGVASGTGFFVTPDLIATNRHVIEDADPSGIKVTNEKIGRLTSVEVVASTPTSDIGYPDIALLRVRPPVAIQPLALTTVAAPLDQVIAAGFPGLLMRADANFEKLLHGDSSAIPQVILTDGRINAIQPTPSGMRIMPHSAAVSGGNSGGPLVDACGRVVGINTFITADRQQVVHANYAEKADGVITFLRDHGAAVTEVAGPCTPETPAAIPSPPAAAPASAPSAAAPPAAAAAPAAH